MTYVVVQNFRMGCDLFENARLRCANVECGRCQVRKQYNLFFPPLEVGRSSGLVQMGQIVVQDIRLCWYLFKNARKNRKSVLVKSLEMTSVIWSFSDSFFVLVTLFSPIVHESNSIFFRKAQYHGFLVCIFAFLGFICSINGIFGI